MSEANVFRDPNPQLNLFNKDNGITLNSKVVTYSPLVEKYGFKIQDVPILISLTYFFENCN